LHKSLLLHPVYSYDDETVRQNAHTLYGGFWNQTADLSIQEEVERFK